MIKLKNLLYPTDFSDFCTHARPYAVELAKQFDAKLHLLHVITLPYNTYPDEALASSMSVHKETIHNAEEKLRAFAKTIQDESGIEIDGMIKEGTAFVEICTTARDLDIDIIVMPTHGHGIIKHMLIGSTAERVVRKAPCPVLTIRHPEHEFVYP